MMLGLPWYGLVLVLGLPWYGTVLDLPFTGHALNWVCLGTGLALVLGLLSYWTCLGTGLAFVLCLPFTGPALELGLY
jgi:hypothetical protein